MNAWYDDYLIREENLFRKRIAKAKKTIAELIEAVETFKKDHGRYPESLDALIERPAELNMSGLSKIGRWPYFKAKRIPSDLWGQHYRYLVPGRYNPGSFDIWSVHGESRNPKVWIGNWEAKG